MQNNAKQKEYVSKKQTPIEEQHQEKPTPKPNNETYVSCWKDQLKTHNKLQCYRS